MCFFFRRQAAQMLRELCKQHVALCPDRDGDVGSYTLAMEKNEKKMNMDEHGPFIIVAKRL